ncbi:MAG: class III extradiol ring-cleavage dioxygenase [Micropepsaceae bacterium]
MPLPTLFVSHGAPTVATGQSSASAFLRSLATRLPKPTSILVASAHWEEPELSIGLGTDTIHDFYGFPQALYRVHYPAVAAKDIAARAMDLLGEQGIRARVDATRGRDHGVWVPLSLAWPQANIPVAQISLVGGAEPAHHFAIGRALKPLRDEGVLIIGSGSATHNLRARPTPAPAEWASSFMQWLDSTLDARDDAALQNWRKTAPDADIAHPTTEHFDPIFLARGAAEGESVTRLHASWDFGSLSMNTYAFGL